MSKYVIIHGQLRELSDDELMHWKYIKREKVNGKWVYTYDLKQNVKDKIGITAKENMNKYKTQYDKQNERIDRNARDTVLYHYGVPGMKWGVRRAQKYASAGRIERLQRKNAKYTAKADKYAAKANKHMYKGADTYLNNLVRGHAFTKQHRQKASRYMANSVHYRTKADAVKAKLEKEAAYVEKMKMKVSAIPKAELDAGYAFCKDFLKS